MIGVSRAHELAQMVRAFDLGWPTALSELEQMAAGAEAAALARRKPPRDVPCLACWLARAYGTAGKTHTGTGPRCPRS